MLRTLRIVALTALFALASSRASAQATAYAPAQGTFGLTLYEDSFPANGDLDFNDQVVAWNYLLSLDGTGRVASMTATFNVLAAGANYRNGLYLHLPGVGAAAATATLTVEDPSGNITSAPLAARAGERELVFELTADTRTQFQRPGDAFINTDAALATQVPLRLALAVQFADGQGPASGDAPFDLYLSRPSPFTGGKELQIHKPIFAGTDQMDPAAFGTADDGSTLASGGLRFINKQGLPFALDVPQSALWMQERIELSAGYSGLLTFASGQGALDWYSAATDASELFSSGLDQSPPPVPRFVDGSSGQPAAAQLIFLSGGQVIDGPGFPFPAVQVEVADADGNLVADSTATVTLAYQGPGALNGTLSVAAAGGIATFSDLSATASGGFNLLALSDGLSQGISFGYVGISGVPAQLQFLQQPQDVTSGGELFMTVALLDAFGNPANAEGTFIELAPQPGGFFGETEGQVFGGVAAFYVYVEAAAGQYSFTATADGLPGVQPVQSQPFQVQPTAPIRGQFQGLPASAAAGEEVPAFTVSFYDAFGNLAGDGEVILYSVDPSTGAQTEALEENVAGGVATFAGLVAGSSSFFLIAEPQFALGEFDVQSEVVTVAGPGRLAIAGLAALTNAGAPIAPFTVQLLDSAGNPGGGSNAISIAVPGASLSGTTSVTALNGVATFSDLVLSGTAGSYTVTASADGLTSATQPIALDAGAASRLVITQQPAGGTAVLHLSLTAVFFDAFGNVADVALPVALSASPANAQLGGYLNIPSVHGVAAFSDVELASAGTFVLSASSGLLSAAANAIVVAPGPASKLVFTQQPQSTFSGGTFGAVADITDASGNVVPISNIVALTVSPGVQMSGIVYTVAYKGVAQFPGLSIETAGTYQLEATYGSLVGVSDSFNIGAVNQVAFLQQPQPAWTDFSIGTVQVALLDSSGSPSDISAPVTLVTQPATALSGTLTVTSSHGVATFSDLSIGAAGTYQLVASGASLSGTSQAVVISAQPPHLTAFVSESPFISGGGIASADAQCQADATAHKFAGSYLALLATSEASIASRFALTSPLPILLPDRAHTQLASNIGALLGASPAMDNPFDVLADGSLVSSAFFPWTGAASSGVAAALAASCDDWTNKALNGGYQGAVGDYSSPSSFFGGSVTSCANSAARLLCLQAPAQ